MKNLLLLIFCSILTAASACSSGGKKNSQDSLANEPAELTCYIAIQGADTAHLSISKNSKGKITGELLINYTENPDNNGKFTAEYKGDTLFADYTFTTGDNATTFRNPLAFLRDSNDLVLGVGEIESYLGRSYFKKGVPINFAIAKFRFQPKDCPNR